MWDGNPVIGVALVTASLLLGCMFLWEAAALTLAQVNGGPLWRVTLSELVMRYPVLGAAIIIGSLFFLGWLGGHWWDAVRGAR